MSIISSLKFDSNDLIPAIVQDYKTGDVLMMAYMNRESLELTIAKRQGVFYSRSRKKLWFKGEQSGHTQIVKELLADCDRDVILLKVEQVGGITCHTGRKSCFFNTLVDDDWQINSKIIKDPKDIYE